MSLKSMYFKHDYGAKDDQKLLELRAEYGAEGYGVFWMLIESMFQNGGVLDRGAIGGLSLAFGIPRELLKKIIDDAINLDLFFVNDGDENLFYNTRINEELGARKLLSEKGKEGAKKRWNSRVAIGGAYAIDSKDNKDNKDNKDSKDSKDKKKDKKKEKQKDVLNDLKKCGHFKNKDFSELFDIYVDTRGQMTRWSQILMLRKLFRYDVGVSIKSLENSIENGWKGVFPENITIDKKKEEIEFLNSDEKEVQITVVK